MTPNPVRLVEAALFSAGKPLSVDEMVQATKLGLDAVKDALKQLHAEYGQRESALEVVKAGPKWAMAVRTEFAEHTKMLAPPEIPRKVLKTLALIAFHQPIKQADLKDMIGSVVYDHVHELYERGMVTARQDGITKILATTDRFIEYFGLDAEKPEEIRTVLAQRLGLDVSQLRPKGSPPPSPGPEQATLDEASPPAASEPSIANVAS